MYGTCPTDFQAYAYKDLATWYANLPGMIIDAYENIGTNVITFLIKEVL